MPTFLRLLLLLPSGIRNKHLHTYLWLLMAIGPHRSVTRGMALLFSVAVIKFQIRVMCRSVTVLLHGTALRCTSVVEISG